MQFTIQKAAFRQIGELIRDTCIPCIRPNMKWIGPQCGSHNMNIFSWLCWDKFHRTREVLSNNLCVWFVCPTTCNYLNLNFNIFYLELELCWPWTWICWSTGRAAVREWAAKPRGVRVRERAAKPWGVRIGDDLWGRAWVNAKMALSAPWRS